MIHNPILSGFYPDPSIVRVEKDFYLITSSFSYFPGIPVFHSRDLANWKQIGHVLDRKSQLPLTYEMMNMGIFAPTIRYHDGIFYVITTNTLMQGSNFIVTAKNPAGPWSEPHIIEGAVGIDPSLFFDDDGKAYYTGTSGYGEQPGIWCSEIDLTEMKLIGNRKFIWSGALRGAASPEAPHLYKKDGWYYLMIAEGGTEHYHAVTISRSREVMGEYMGFEGNPILTHRHLGRNYPICNVGHGDLVELEDGSWYMVMLGSRLMDGYYKILGRETFIAPVTWENGWPVVSCGSGKVEMCYPNSVELESPAVKNGKYEVRDDFDKDELDFQWNFLGTPYEDFVKIENSCLGLKLLKKELTPWEFHGISTNLIEKYVLVGKTKECVSFLGRRQQHMNFEVIVKMIFTPEESEKAGLAVLQNDAHQLRVECCVESQKTVIKCIKTKLYVEDDKQYYDEQCQGCVKWSADNMAPIYLKIEGRGTSYSFYAGLEENDLAVVAENVDGSFLGAECVGNMVGAYIGMFASGVSETKDKYALFDWFTYREI